MAQETWSFLATQDYEEWFSVKEIVAALNMPENTVRDQLQKFTNKGIVTKRWDGRMFRYRRRAYLATSKLPKGVS